MQKYKDVVILFIALSVTVLSSCTEDNGSSGKNLTSNIEAAAGSDIIINVAMADDLQGEIAITQAEGKKPGDRNSVDLSITVKNQSGSSMEIFADGKWYDHQGNQRGGQSSVLILAAGQSIDFLAGTNSRSVTAFQLTLSPNDRSASERTFDALSDSSQQIAEGYGMTWSETAADEIIPALPVKGFANGEPFEGQTVAFVQGVPGKWTLEISDGTFDVRTGPGIARYDRKTLQTIYLNFSEPLSAGDRLVREMNYGGGYFQIKSPTVADSTTSWNTSMAYLVEITDWNMGSYKDQPCSDEKLGSFSGKLYISFEGSPDGIANSWISGQFIDAPIVYCGAE
jgi:hypothetical protein